MKQSFLTFCVSLAFLCGCDNNVTTPGSLTLRSTADGLWLIEWHTNSTWLSYAVISEPSQDGHGHVRTGGGGSGKQWAYLVKPDGTETSILDSGHVFQISGINVTEISNRLSAATFEAFLQSHPTNYSLPSLLKFAGIQK